MNHKYFILTDNAYLKINNQGIIDLPQDFINSNDPQKRIKLLNMEVGDKTDHKFKSCTFHSHSLCDGNFSQYNYFITSYNPARNVVQKEYPIGSKCQHIVFSFRDTDGEEIDISQLKFIIELELIF